MKCTKCNAALRENDELKWECNSCHQMCKANLAMLGQIQAQRDKGYTGAMVNCPFCGGVLDDGNETIHWDCIYCGERITGNIRSFLRPDAPERREEPEALVANEKTEDALHWAGEEEKAEEKPKAAEKKGFFADEEEKNRFLAESTSQALGEEIPDSFFDDIPLRRQPKPASPGAAANPASNASTSTGQSAGTAANPASNASPFVEPPAGAAANPASNASPFVESASEASAAGRAGAAGNPVATSAASATPGTSAASAAGRQTAGAQSADTYTGTSTAPGSPVPPAPSKTTPSAAAGSTPSGGGKSSAAGTASAGSTASKRPMGPKTASGPIPPSSTGFASADTGSGATAPKGPDSDNRLENVSFEKPREVEKKQIWPKVIMAITTLVIIAAIVLGAVVAGKYFMSPTRQFRSAVKEADYTEAEELFHSKIEGNEEDERMAYIAVEHFLSEEFEAYKNGTSDGASYLNIREFAEDVMNMNTADYQMVAEATPEPTEEAYAEPEATEEASGEPAAGETGEDPEASEGAEEAPEATEGAEEAPEVSEDTEKAPGAEEGSKKSGKSKKTKALKAEPEETKKPAKPKKTPKAVPAAKETEKPVKPKKPAKPKKTKAPKAEPEETKEPKAEPAGKAEKAAKIKEFNELCEKLTIVYYASEKRYHIVPRGYYTNYNQISRSNNVGGIAYMNQAKNKVSITKIGAKGELSSYGKANRANLKKFKQMIEQYPYLRKEI